MRVPLIILAGAVALTGCSPPHRFEIASDDTIKSVEVDLINMKSSQVRLMSSHHALVQARTADSSGEIRVQLGGGEVVPCRVGYITNGDEESHKMVISNGRCDVL